MAIAVYMVIILVAAYFVLPETLPEKTPSAISRP